MASNFRTFYLYTVSLITLIMVIGGIVATVNNITSYFFPDSYVFCERERNGEDNVEDNIQYDYSEVAEDTDENDTTKKLEIRKQNYKNEKIKNVVVSVVVVIVGGIMHRYHWNIIQKERIG